MPDYSNSKIYIIRSHQTDDVYIGSTVQRWLCKRLGSHRAKYNLWKENKHHYITSFELIKYPDCYIELLESFNCNNHTELTRKEGEYIQKIPNCVNKQIAGRTKQEYYEANKQQLLEYKKEWYNKNKETVAVKKKLKYEQIKDTYNQKRREVYYQKKLRMLETNVSIPS